MKVWNAADRLWYESFFSEPDLVYEKDQFTVDITDEGEIIKLKAELPGVKKEDISVDLDEGALLIKAEKKQVNVSESQTYLRKERKYGMMQRAFSIGDIKPENISATYLDGILNIEIKKEPIIFKKIKIK